MDCVCSGQDAVITADHNSEHLERVFSANLSRDEVDINGHTGAKTDTGKEEKYIVGLFKDEPPEPKKKQAHIPGIDEVKAHLEEAQVYGHNRVVHHKQIVEKKNGCQPKGAPMSP